MTPQDKAKIDEFSAEWLSVTGYKPAPFQKAIALQRLWRGQSIGEIIAALIAMRV